MMGWAREREADEKIYLDADAVLGCFHAWRDRHGDVHEPDEMEEFQKILALPAADVRENRHGQWLHVFDTEEGEYWECSECGAQWVFTTEGSTPDSEEAHYCPNCGADMRPRTEEDDG